MSSSVTSNYSAEDVHAIHMKAAKMFIVNLRDDDRAKEYVEGRGLNFAWALDNGIGYALPKWGQFSDSLSKPERKLAKACGLIGYSEKTNRHYDAFRDRIMFPILNNDGLIVAMGGRDISGESDAKYINTKDTEWFKKHEVLYNLHRCSSLNQSDLVVVEGYMDVIAARHAGINNFTAVMGTAFSEHHAQAALDRGIKSMTFCYDGDDAGLGAALRSLSSVGILKSGGVHVSYVFLPKGDDPDDIINRDGPDALNALLSEGISPEVFVAEHYLQSLNDDPSSIDISLKVVNEALDSAHTCGLDVVSVWSRLEQSLDPACLNICGQYALNQSPELAQRSQAVNSPRNQEESAFKKQPM